MAIFTNKPKNEEVEPMTLKEITNMIINDDLHIVFGDELCEHLLEVNVRFKGDNSRIITIRNGYKDGRDNKKIDHFYEPSLKYIQGDKFGNGGVPIVIPKVFNGKLEIQGKQLNTILYLI